MAVYKFKLFIEDSEDIYREIEILSGQTFEDFHVAIQEAYKFDKKHAASFFVSDDYWRKDQEITLREEDLPLEEEEIRKNVSPKKLMSKTKIAKYIDSPRQRFMYVFDPAVKWAFCIELMKILPDNPKGNYPACVKSIGTAPKQYKQDLAAKGELTPEQAMAALLSEPEIADESEIYKAIKNDTIGIDEGDLNHLEGEEGEDGAVEEDDVFADSDEDLDHDEEVPEGYGSTDED
ncbi:MAG: plasmid pRiA4b family protein [Bacteroidota bacterium]|jgi:hypothetical protein|nr:plasmid pRiA4b family protein [Bacteroidota bacterium]